jgi:hypothetical protein
MHHQHAAMSISCASTLGSGQHRDGLSGTLDQPWVIAMRDQYMCMAREHTQSIPYLGGYCQCILRGTIHRYRQQCIVHAISPLSGRKSQQPINYQARSVYHRPLMDGSELILWQKRRQRWTTFFLCFGIPIILAGLRECFNEPRTRYTKPSVDYVVQGHRYNIFEDLGPLTDTYNVTLAFPLFYMWEPILCIMSAVFGVMTVRLIRNGASSSMRSSIRDQPR